MIECGREAEVHEMHIQLGNNVSRHFKTFILLVIGLLQYFHQSQAPLSNQPIGGDQLTYSYMLASCRCRQLFSSSSAVVEKMMLFFHTQMSYSVNIFALMLRQSVYW